MASRMALGAGDSGTGAGRAAGLADPKRLAASARTDAGSTAPATTSSSGFGSAVGMCIASTINCSSRSAGSRLGVLGPTLRPSSADLVALRSLPSSVAGPECATTPSPASCAGCPRRAWRRGSNCTAHRLAAARLNDDRGRGKASSNGAGAGATAAMSPARDAAGLAGRRTGQLDGDFGTISDRAPVWHHLVLGRPGDIFGRHAIDPSRKVDQNIQCADSSKKASWWRRLGRFDSSTNVATAANGFEIRDSSDEPRRRCAPPPRCDIRAARPRP